MSIRVIIIYRIIETIGEHIGAQHALSRAGVDIRVNKASGFGVVIAGIEIVESRFVIVVVATIPERIQSGNMSGVGRTDSIATTIQNGSMTAPRIVGVLRHFVAVAIHNLDNIALTVVDIVIVCYAAAIFVLETIPRAGFIVQIGQPDVAGGIFPDDGAATEGDVVGMPTYCLGSADAAIVVGVSAFDLTIPFVLRQFPSVLPCSPGGGELPSGDVSFSGSYLLKKMLYPSKHRLCDTSAAVRNISETF